MEGVIEDISERKLAEELMHKTKQDLELQVAERTRELTALNEELHQLSLSDGLTGLGNRRSLDELLALVDVTFAGLIFVGLDREKVVAQCALIEGALEARDGAVQAIELQRIGVHDACHCGANAVGTR